MAAAEGGFPGRNCLDIKVSYCYYVCWGGVGKGTVFLPRIYFSRKNGRPELFLFLISSSGGCLSAPAEVSLWTKFCELGLPSAINQIGRMEMGGGGSGSGR